MVSVQAATPNVITNPLPNYGAVNINMIETDDYWCVTKVITPVVHDELEMVVALLSVKEKKSL